MSVLDRIVEATRDEVERRRELVPLARKADELRFLAEALERDEKLFGLFDRAAVVLVAVEDQQRRRDVRGVFERALVPKPLQIVPGVAADLLFGKIVADVRGTVKRQPVADAPLRHRRAEQVGLRYEPVRHEAAVGTAREVHGGVGVGVCPPRRLSDGEHVVGVDGAVTPLRGRGEV